MKKTDIQENEFGGKKQLANLRNTTNSDLNLAGIPVSVCEISPSSSTNV
jgi:hypothetical protein